jgi:hypothetical protein
LQPSAVAPGIGDLKVGATFRFRAGLSCALAGDCVCRE